MFGIVLICITIASESVTALTEADTVSSFLYEHTWWTTHARKDPGRGWSRDTAKTVSPRGVGKISNYMLPEQ